jgi:hypothetical protein
MGKFYWLGFFVGAIGALIINVFVWDTGNWGIDLLLMFLTSFILTFVFAMGGAEIDRNIHHRKYHR